MPTYDGLYNLVVKEHILSICPTEKLHQHLVDSKLSSPIELGKMADDWTHKRVDKKSPWGDSKQGGLFRMKGKELSSDAPEETSQVPQTLVEGKKTQPLPDKLGSGHPKKWD